MSHQNSLPTVCIVGRTNVGKSTLFNAIVGRRTAVVKDQAGVTRDRYYELVTRHDFPFTLIDTGALVGEEDLVLHEAVRQQTALAMQQSDLIIVVFDGLHGLHPLDSEVVDLVRQMEKPTIYVANKCEKPSAAMTATELYGLGLDEIIPLSAAHRRGLRDLLGKMEELVGSSGLRSELADGKDAAYQENEDEGEATPVRFEDEESEELDQNAIPDMNADEPALPGLDEDPDRAINIAIIGKPNVGKSTFVNRLLGEDRLITSPIAGTTRDSITCELTRNGQKFQIVDTAGLRKKAGVKDNTVERFSNIRTLRSLAQSDVAVFLLDASEGIPTEQDARIVGLAHEKGKSLVIVVNKWDLIEKDPRIAEEYRHAIRMTFKFAAYAPVIFVSALTGLRCLSVFDEVKMVYAAARVRLTTGQVNKLFTDAFNSKPPPVYRGIPIKLLYATQVAANPPTFAVFVNHPERLRFNYERYLKNTVRRHYPFPGSDVRILFRRRSRITNQRRRVA
ncbi:MAG: GTPase EngA [Pseudomonadota bacterium]|jgi:GTP-binding protein